MTTARKTCFKCGMEKPINDFYVHPAMGDGRLNKCKPCTRRDVRSNYQANIDRYREYDRERGYRASDPTHARARRMVRDAVARGEMTPKPCEVGEDCRGRIEAHHDDYSKPLEVRWLCKRHHSEVHIKHEHAA